MKLYWEWIPVLQWLKVTEAFGWFWQNSRVCAATKAKQSGSRCSAGPSQSATANWLLWEPRTVTQWMHKSTQKHWHTNSGPPSHLLGARTYRCSCFPNSELRRCSGSQQPVVVFYQCRALSLWFCKPAVYDSSLSFCNLPSVAASLCLRTRGALYTARELIIITLMPHGAPAFHAAS